MNNLIEKLGFNKYAGMGQVKFSFEDVSDARVKQELLLIQNVQLYNDFFAEEQLIASYRGQISNLVNSSKAKNLLGYDMVFQHAISALKSCIKKYDLSSYKNNKPLTYFTTNINFELSKLYRSETVQKGVKMSSDLNVHKNTIEIAKSILTPKFGRNPSNEEILNFIKNDLKQGSGLDMSKMNRISKYETKELSSSIDIGSNNASGAEALTFEDVISHTDSIDDILVNDSKEQLIKKAIDEFSNGNEKEFLLNYFGVDKFKNSPLKGNTAKLRTVYGMNFYQSSKLLNNFKNHCSLKGIL